MGPESSNLLGESSSSEINPPSESNRSPSSNQQLIPNNSLGCVRFTNNEFKAQSLFHPPASHNPFNPMEDVLYNPTRGLNHIQSHGDSQFLDFNRVQSMQGNGLSTDNLLERLMMGGKHSGGLPPKVPSMQHATESLDHDSNGPNPEHQHSTMVPPTFNPVFWLLHSSGSSSSEPIQSTGKPFPGHNQHSAPEIEMRLGPFAPSSSSAPHDFHGESFQRFVQDRGDLSSITANLQLRSGSGSAHDDAMNVDHTNVRRPYRWQGQNGSEPSSSSTSNDTGISHPCSHLVFQEPSGNHLWSNADSTSGPTILKPGHLPGQDAISDTTSTRPRFSSDQGPDHDTVMKWNDLLPTPENNPRQNHNINNLSRSQGSHPHTQNNGPSSHAQFSTSQQPLHCMTWQMQASHGGHDAMFDSMAPMSQELQRMAAVLDQI